MMALDRLDLVTARSDLVMGVYIKNTITFDCF